MAFMLSGLNKVAAQEIVVPEGYMLVDSIVYRPASAVDTTLVGKNILGIMPRKADGGDAEVNVYQSEAMNQAMEEHLSQNA